MKNKTDNEEKNDKNKRIIIYIIVIIIIILSLLTSCSCTSRFFGKIGDGNINEGEYNINDNTNDLPKILNQDLKFDKENLEISLNETKYKLGFTYQNFISEDFSCNTSDGSIATCYVSNGYVVINPLAPGKIVVSLQTTANGKLYIATAKVTITDTKKYIELSSQSGTLNIAYSNIKNISYKLIGITGDVSVKSSDENIAIATVSNGIIKITAKKTGIVTITLTVNYNGIDYEESYILNVVKYSNNPNPSNPDIPNNPDDKPSTPDNPGENKNSDTSLKVLTGDGISLKENNFIEVSGSSISLNITPNASTSVIIYNNQEYKSLNELVIGLNQGVNFFDFQVKAEDGTIKDYHLTIYRKTTGGGSSTSSPTLKIDSNKTCYIEKNYCSISYDILDSKGASILNAEEAKKINFNIPGISSNDIDISQPGLIIIKNYSNKKIGETINIIIDSNNYKAATSKVTFDIDNYELYPILDKNSSGLYVKYIDLVVGNSNTGVLNIFSEFFKNNNFKVYTSFDNQNINLCADSNQKMCITISNDNPDILSIFYNPTISEDYPTTFPIVLNAKKTGEAKLNISGKIYDKQLPSFTVTVSISEEIYTVTINPNTGSFKLNDNKPRIYALTAANNRELDLTTIDIPFRLTDDSGCFYNKLIGYSTTTSKDKILYSPYTTDMYETVVKNLKENITLYAIYDDENHSENLENIYTKTLWMDVPLFTTYNHDEYGTIEKDFYYNRNEDNLIYPGASGHYHAIYTNNTKYDIIVKGMILQELKTICVDEGCLNMGYIIRKTNEKKPNIYYYGNQPQYLKSFNDSDYKVLNKNKYENIDFTNINGKDETITITKNGGQSNLDIFWHWVEINDELDTKIGKKAYELAKNTENIYQVAIGVEFYSDSLNTCKKP